MRFRVATALVAILSSVCAAADRHWETGVWTDVSIKRQLVDFGPGASPFDGGHAAPSMRAMADVAVYVLETDTLRLEIKDVVPVNKRSLDVVVGHLVTFALEKNSVYVRDADGIEHRLRVTKKTTK